jgi:hypothetical protein
VQLSCIDPAGVAVTYALDANPEHGALSAFDSAAGKVTYTPAAGYSGADSFTYHATSSNGTAAGRTASITVNPPPQPTVGRPTVSHLSLSGVGKRKPKLSFTLIAGRNAPTLEKIAITLPGGLSFNRHRLADGLKVTNPSGKELKLTAKSSGRTLTITLRAPAGEVSVAISDRAITATRTAANKVKRHKVKTLSVVVTATDARGTATKIIKTLKAK